ncbi:TetR/AcrR family transcriptional regulator C-terminal domain-containing protein [Demequina zhanjiangensis]|uniref:TetR/AcrR family transcriptional regulator C-terminal domain-containing protein n=1 Tax=Demequina zhanjiangensis TaxID=3051659 RepID=A0ABT8G279_9MICO|nr:TetR/AcrR family transcriptional regulator C-terminal domain-containing protein [Demequina sp. SYSU T00b26]MDN4473049.1 TetR/AcrR family transcriptional regulator C-terminal domain-containing protein [Demequina sp. SYSU T00b26]
MTAKRQGPGRPPIPTDRILDAALQILDEGGPDALSLREVARVLSSSTSTLYRHVSGRAALVDLVIDRMIGEVDLREETYSDIAWDDACRALATSFFEALSRHGAAAGLLVGSIPMGPNGMALRERLLDALMGAGFPPETCARAMASLAHYCVGFAMQSPAEREERDSSGASGALAATRAAGPRLASVAEYLPRPLHDEFAFGLDMLLRGLAATRQHQDLDG